MESRECLHDVSSICSQGLWESERTNELLEVLENWKIVLYSSKKKKGIKREYNSRERNILLFSRSYLLTKTGRGNKMLETLCLKGETSRIMAW